MRRASLRIFDTEQEVIDKIVEEKDELPDGKLRVYLLYSDGPPVNRTIYFKKVRAQILGTK